MLHFGAKGGPLSLSVLLLVGCQHTDGLPSKASSKRGSVAVSNIALLVTGPGRVQPSNLILHKGEVGLLQLIQDKDVLVDRVQGCNAMLEPPFVIIPAASEDCEVKVSFIRLPLLPKQSGSITALTHAPKIKRDVLPQLKNADALATESLTSNHIYRSSSPIEVKPTISRDQQQGEELVYHISSLMTAGQSREKIEQVVQGTQYDGDYFVTFALNGRASGVGWVRLEGGKPCIRSEQVSGFRLQPAFVKYQGEGCLDLSIAGMSASFDVHQLQLNLVVPQTHIEAYTPTLDGGGTALVSNYQLFYNDSLDGRREDVLGMSELGFRHDNWIFQSHQIVSREGFRNSDASVRRDFTDVGLTMDAGRINLQSNALSGFQFDGVQVSSNSQQRSNRKVGKISGYAAQVSSISIVQGNKTIFTTVVQAGEYFIPGIPLLNLYEDLVVTEQTDDGQTKTYRTPPAVYADDLVGAFSGVDESFFVAVGQLRESDKYFVASGLTMDVGQSWLSNVDVGAMTDTDSAVNVGLSVGGRANEQMYYNVQQRLSYGKENGGPERRLGKSTFVSLGGRVIEGWMLSLNYARYSADYLSVGQDSLQSTLARDESDAVKNSYGLNVSVPLLDRRYGGLSAGYFRNNKRDGSYTDYFRANYVVSVGKANVTAVMERDLAQSQETRVGLNVSVPFDYASQTYRTNHQMYQQDGSWRYGSSVSTSVGATQYQANVNGQTGGGETLAGVGVNHNARFAAVSARYSQGRDTRAMGLSMGGGVVVTGGGVALSGSPVSDTFAVLTIKDAKTGEGAEPYRWGEFWRLDRLVGNKVVEPNLRSYQENAIGVDERYMPSQYEGVLTTIRKTPMTGTVVEADFYVRKVVRLLLSVRDEDGAVLKDGVVFNGEGEQVSEIDSFGQLYLSADFKDLEDYRVTVGAGVECRLVVDTASLRQKAKTNLQVGEASCVKASY